MNAPLIRRLAIQAGIGLVLGWAGPFGTQAMMPLPQRLLYWVICVPVIGLFVRFAMRSLIGKGWPMPVRIAAGSFLAGFPAAFVVLLLHGLFVGAMSFDAQGLIEVYLTVCIAIGLAAYPLTLLAAARHPAETPPPEPEVDSPFLRRIPQRLGTDLLFLSAEDHYIRVTTALGSDLILFRLSDAVAELGPAGGQQVHRSHWVAQGAVKSVERKEGKTALLLLNGDSVPVSQSYVPSLKAAGWL